MNYKLIDGKATATAIKKEIAEEVRKIVEAGGKRPHLAAVLVGHDGGSETYVKNKVIACEQCGFKSTLIRFEADVTEEELLACVDKLNKEKTLMASFVQLPLPKHIDEQKIIMAVDYRKDVDGSILSMWGVWLSVFLALSLLHHWVFLPCCSIIILRLLVRSVLS